MREAIDEDYAKKLATAKEQLNSLIPQEESYWRQRAKVYWLRDGDINSRFIHSYATTRKNMNNIVSLVHDDGMVVTDHNKLCNVANSYFDQLYCGTTIEIDEVINHVSLYLSSDDNSLVTTPFSINEFKTTFFSNGLKQII